MLSDAYKVQRKVARLAARGIDRWGFPTRPGNLRPGLVSVAQGKDVSQWTGLRDHPRAARKQTGKGSYVEDRLLCGLRALCGSARKGQIYTRTEIAKACKVDKDTIRGIERQAIKKIRSRLRAGSVEQLGAFLQMVAEQSNPPTLHLSLSKT